MYNIRPSGYFWRGKEQIELFDSDKDESHLFYAALEFRICIERFLFETLVLLKIEGLSKKFEKLYRAKELARTIHKIEPDFVDKLKFMNVFLEALGLGNRIFIIDLNYLNRLYGRLGGYLHALKDPDLTTLSEDWWGDFNNDLRETEEYLESGIGYDIGSFDLNEQGLDLFKKWKNEKLSKEATIEIIQKEIFK